MHVTELLQLRSRAKSDRDRAVPLLIQDLDPDIRRFVDEVSAAWARHGDLSTKTPEEARRIAEEVRAPWRQGGPNVSSAEWRVAGLRVRCYDPNPSERRKPALVYLHGGGWMVFSIDTHDRVMREYASRSGAMVIGIDYPLAPEAKYPVALNRIVDVVKFFAGRGYTLGIGGDSAGANLAIATAIRLRDERQPILRALVLNYGVFDRHTSRDAAGEFLTAAEMEQYWRNYLRDESDAEDPCAVPLKGDLRGLPPALLVVPEFDVLTDQSLRLAKRLEKVQVNFYRGATHSFLEAVSISALASRAFDETAAWLRANLV